MAQANAPTDIKTQTLKGTDNHIKTHSESHKSADTQIYKEQTSSYTNIETSANTYTRAA